ncbi:hypothetical protein NDU88_007241 [Pleurodeles waltl]|uniref:Uncharacterized protein n=1 Tax=Pleurodeles waltl TaxID=8319 RepID=A0AAV7MFG8_PLEWA|nr:hypothetical protein NDU88_007241 [Pleurodeles waltl]
MLYMEAPARSGSVSCPGETPPRPSKKMRDSWLLTVTLAVAIFLACALGEPASSEEEWKSLGNPYNRDLFFKFMKSYIMGRGMHAVAAGWKEKVGNHLRRSNSASSTFQQDTSRPFRF